jgi:DNA-binding GntR family transcriptional regulator
MATNTPRDRALPDDLAQRIQSRVMSGDIPVGSWLRQEHLAREFGVSRTPIREAIRQLQAIGLVVVVPNRGAAVRGPSRRDIQEAYVVRAELEGLAAHIATGRLGADGLRQLGEAEALFETAAAGFALLERDARANENARADWVQANNAFHETVQRAAGNERLVRAISDGHRTFPRSLTALPLIEEPALFANNIAEHQAVRRALINGDPDAARDAMRQHVLAAGELVAAFFERHGLDGDE